MEEAQGFLPILPLICAHEIGHTTGTANERQPCNPFEPTGFSNFINSNCEANPATEACLMREMSQVVCNATRSHFGWGDQNGDGIIDAFDPNFVLVP